MRLHIKTKGFRLHLLLPTGLVLSRLGLAITLRACRRYVTLPPQRRSEVLRLLGVLRQQCRGLTVVEIRTQDGEEIRLSL